MLVLFGPIREAERVFDSVLVGRDWLKYRNKVRSEIVVIGVNRWNDRAERQPGSKQILYLFLFFLIVMLLHQAVGSYCRQSFPSLSILCDFSLILACLATGCRWMASWTGVTVGSKSNKTGFPNCPNLLCTSGYASRTHSRVILAGQDGNNMFGRGSSNIGVGIGSGSIGIFLVREFSGVDSCTEGSG